MTLPARQVGRADARRLVVVAGDVDPAAVDAAYAADHWQADALGIDAMRGRDSARFIVITERIRSAKTP